MDDNFQRFSSGLWAQSLLFNIFARKLSKQCTSSTFQFADDTTLATANPSLSAVAENLSQFLCRKRIPWSHKLKINPEKTQLTLKNPGWFSTYAWQPYYQASENSQTPGCHLRSTPYFQATYWQRNQQMPRTLGILARATPYLPKELLKLIYTALIGSHMEYCSAIFSSATKTHLKKLDVIQRKAARITYTLCPKKTITFLFF